MSETSKRPPRSTAVNVLPLTAITTVIRRALPRLVEQITEQIQNNVVAYSSRSTGQLRRAISTSVSVAARTYVDELDGNAAAEAKSDSHFHHVGFKEATTGNPFACLVSAHAFAHGEAVTLLKDLVEEHHLSVQMRTRLDDTLTGYMQRVHQQVRRGYGAGLHSSQGAIDLRKLTTPLMHGYWPQQAQQLAALHGWIVPQGFFKEFFVASFRPGKYGCRGTVRLADRLLYVSDHGWDTLFINHRTYQAAAEEIRAQRFSQRVALTKATSVSDVPFAIRWTRRSIHLAEQGRLPTQEDGFINCENHFATLWLNGEPLLQQHLQNGLLAPLNAEIEATRIALATTMLLWLQTRASAPALAKILKLHPQTVRARLRRVHSLFGSQLNDPRQSLLLAMALTTQVPTWQAEAQAHPAGRRAS